MRYQKLRYWLYRTRQIHPLPILICFLLLVVYCLHQYPFPTLEHPIYANSIKSLSKRANIPHKPPEFKSTTQAITKDVVIAATTSSNLAWLSELHPEEWTPYIYLTNATPSQVSATENAYTVPMNKGNEAMAYLTHIIDHYDNLADVTVFHHDHYTSWHQDFTSPTELHLLRASHILNTGYVSLRCPKSKTPSCSDHDTIKLSSVLIPLKRLSPLEPRAALIPSLFQEFLGKEEAKRIIGEERVLRAPCCAMFAVSREAVRRRDIEVWRGLREWLVKTEMQSLDAGRIFEWTWHVWFGMDAVL